MEIFYRPVTDFSEEELAQLGAQQHELVTKSATREMLLARQQIGVLGRNATRAASVRTLERARLLHTNGSHTFLYHLLGEKLVGASSLVPNVPLRLQTTPLVPAVLARRIGGFVSTDMGIRTPNIAAWADPALPLDVYKASLAEAYSFLRSIGLNNHGGCWTIEDVTNGIEVAAIREFAFNGPEDMSPYSARYDDGEVRFGAPAVAHLFSVEATGAGAPTH